MIRGHRPQVTPHEHFPACGTLTLGKGIDLVLKTPQMVAESYNLINADDTIWDDAVTSRFMNFQSKPVLALFFLKML